MHCLYVNDSLDSEIHPCSIHFISKFRKIIHLKELLATNVDSFSKLLRLKMQSQPFGKEERPQCRYGILLTEQIDVEKLDNFVWSFRI